MALPHPHQRGRYHARRDLVGDLGRIIIDLGLRMGLYYSGGYDWPFNDALLQNHRRQLPRGAAHPDYVRYATPPCPGVDRPLPAVGAVERHLLASRGDLPSLFAEITTTRCRTVVINDRWIEPPQHRGAVTDDLAAPEAYCSNASGLFIPESAASR